MVGDGDGGRDQRGREPLDNDTGPFGFYCNFEGKRRLSKLGTEHDARDGQAIGLSTTARGRQETSSCSRGSALLLVEARGEGCAHGWESPLPAADETTMLVGAAVAHELVLAVGCHVWSPGGAEGRAESSTGPHRLALENRSRRVEQEKRTEAGRGVGGGPRRTTCEYSRGWLPE